MAYKTAEEIFIEKWTAAMSAEQKEEFGKDLQAYVDDCFWNWSVEASEHE